MRRMQARKYASILVLLLAGVTLCLVAPARLNAAQGRLAGGPAMPSDVGRVAFIHGGDLFTLDLATGAEVQLTHGGGNSEPRWSPSGKWLAFLKGKDQLWITAAQGGMSLAFGAVQAPGFAWSPSADVLAYLSLSGTLMSVNADGSGLQPLAGGSLGPVSQIGHFSWSPDGAWIAFDGIDSIAPAMNGQPPERVSSLWRLSVSDGQAVKLLDDGSPSQDGLIVAGWAPDASKILYLLDPQFSASLLADGAPLFAVPFDGGTPEQLADSVLAYSDFVVPGSTGDAVSLIEGVGRESWTNKTLHVVNLASGVDSTLSGAGIAAASPAWSPDGRQIAYVAMPDLGSLAGDAGAQSGLMQRRLTLVNAQGTPEAVQLTDDATYRDEAPRWSADGGSLLFLRVDAQSHVSLWLLPLKGSVPQQVVDNLSLTANPSLASLELYGVEYFGHINGGKLVDWWTGAPSLVADAGG